MAIIKNNEETPNQYCGKIDNYYLCNVVAVVVRFGKSYQTKNCTLFFTKLVSNQNTVEKLPNHCIPFEKDRMLIEKYTSNWTQNFADLKREIETGLNGLEYRIEHVGSTSIPNLDSKPIIDIDIIYDDESEFKKIKSELIKIGYYHNGNQGIENREVFKRDGKSSHGILDTIPHHLYVCPKDSEPLERHILMRNFLRNNDWARLKYQEMKYELAEKANQNRKLYAQLKELNVNKFIDDIIMKEKKNVQQQP